MASTNHKFPRHGSRAFAYSNGSEIESTVDFASFQISLPVPGKFSYGWCGWAFYCRLHFPMNFLAPATIPGKFCTAGHRLQCKMPNHTNHKFPGYGSEKYEWK